jgi:alpha-methylacyl-CoA racemase
MTLKIPDVIPGISCQFERTLCNDITHRRRWDKEYAVLEGIRIIEIEGLGPAPFAGMQFADLGADVIVVHRKIPPTGEEPESSLLDRGKRSIILDLKDESDLEVLKRLVATADGLVEGFRPGVMERLGLGPQELHDHNPRLVYGRLTGWGQDGPMAPYAGHDLNYTALSGALWYASPHEQSPFTPPTMLGDIGGGALYLVIGMLAALLRARHTGNGAVVDAAIVDGSAHMMNLLMAARSVGMISRDRGRSILDGSPWSRCYQASDGGWLAVQCLEPKFYSVFREKLGVEGDKSFDQDPDPDRWPALADRISTIIASRTLGEWSGVFSGSDACVAPVLDPVAAASNPHMAARKTWTQTGRHLQALAAPRFDGRQPAEPANAPRRGEHTDQVLAEIDSL